MRQPKSSIILAGKNKKNNKKEQITPEETPAVAIDTTPEQVSVKGEESYVIVERTSLGKQDQDSGTIKIRPFVTTPARVEVHAKRYIPLGINEGGVTVAITISMPCYKEEILHSYKKVDAAVEKLMNKKLEEMGINNG